MFIQRFKMNDVNRLVDKIKMFLELFIVGKSEMMELDQSDAMESGKQRFTYQLVAFNEWKPSVALNNLNVSNTFFFHIIFL